MILIGMSFSGNEGKMGGWEQSPQKKCRTMTFKSKESVLFDMKRVLKIEEFNSRKTKENKIKGTSRTTRDSNREI